MHTKQRKTLALIFQTPLPKEIAWDDIESLLRALGANLRQGAGSSLRIELNGVRIVMHIPHPRPVARRGRIEAVRNFLAEAGVKP